MLCILYADLFADVYADLYAVYADLYADVYADLYAVFLSFFVVANVWQVPPSLRNLEVMRFLERPDVVGIFATARLVN